MATTIGSAGNPANFANIGMQVGGNQAYPILQVVVAQSTATTNFTTTSNTFQTTNLSASITPKFSTSKILCYASGVLYSNTAGNAAYASIYRDSTNLGNGSFGLATFMSQSNSVAITASMSFYDSPATTSAITYSAKLKSANGTNTVGFGEVGTGTNAQIMILIEVAQ